MLYTNKKPRNQSEKKPAQGSAQDRKQGELKTPLYLETLMVFRVLFVLRGGLKLPNPIVTLARTLCSDKVSAGVCVPFFFWIFQAVATAVRMYACVNIVKDFKP